MYQIYLGDVLFPVAPESIAIQIKNQNSKLSLVNEGELNVLKSPGLTEFSMTFLLPTRLYPFAQYASGFQSPTYFLSHMEQLKTGKKVFDLTILRSKTAADKYISTLATLETYTIKEVAADNGDLLIDADFKQYIHYGTKVVTIKDNVANGGDTRPPSTADKGKAYTVQDGDTLWGIAQRFYGDGTRCNEVYKANKKVLDDEAARRGMPRESGDRWIFTGTKIVIP